MDKKRYDIKNTVVVKNKIVMEEIVFRGKKIKRERVVKEWNIPKVITNDIGFQLMFGFTNLAKPKKSTANIEEISYTRRAYEDRY